MKTIELALSQIGTQEYKGGKHNKQVLKYFSEIGHAWVKDDETAWCSAFVNWVCKKSGLRFTGKLNARSWINLGQIVTRPKLGDIVVLWRGSKTSWMGHVGFYISHDSSYIYILGGNQNNEVNITRYSKQRLLGYRRL